MSGTVVVGTSATPNDASTSLGHAFADDLSAPHPHMVDLGTLGGRYSTANAVDGAWVVGGADSTDGTSHAFAYDLAAAHPHMIDLGHTIPNCYASAIRATWVVGTCFPPTDQTTSRAFAYDLAAAHPHMLDLGTLGGTTAAAFATDGTWAVGYSTTAGGAAHAFAYELGAAEPKLVDLGTLPGSPWSRADYVEGGRVLGESPPGTFIENLGAPGAAMGDIGALGAAGASPAAASDRWVVGRSATTDGAEHAFAYDFTSSHPQMVDLGTLGGPRSAAVAVADGWVVGTAAAVDGQDHLFACDLAVPHPEMVDLGGGLGGPTVQGSSEPVAVGGGWVVGGPVSARGGFVGHAWAVRVPSP
jgi:probable HAF family extracellular repeat protein